jgi:hypothetical protein
MALVLSLARALLRPPPSPHPSLRALPENPMKKLLSSLGLLLAIGAASTGCTFYFGPDDDDDDGDYYSYCDDSGCYTCYEPTGECWRDGGGFGCSSDADCAAGCFCEGEEYGPGYCVETGFCSSTADCAPGFVCDDRGSCVPDGSTGCETYGCPEGSFCAADGTCIPDTLGCDSDDDCAAACYCDETVGACVESSVCASDADCGDGLTCDEARSSCVPGEDPPPPPPSCAEITTEEACLARLDCDATYTGIGCEDPAGNSCTSNSANCVCDYFVFAACIDAVTP